MWKKLVIEDRNYIIRNTIEEKKYELILSDFSKVWTETLTEEELLKRCKEMNPLYEAESDILIKRILNLIAPDQGVVKKELLEVGNQLTISLSSYLNGLIFKFQFILVQTCPEKFCQHLTFPLIQMIEELQARQKHLCDLLIKKDIEINEYKMEGAQVTRKNVITEPFNENEFLQNCRKDAEKRSLNNLQCPFSYFQESCAELYEECTKRKKVMEEALSPKKEKKINKEMNATKKLKLEKNKKKQVEELEYRDSDDDDDETYFSNPKVAIKTEIKSEPNSSTAPKKKKRVLKL